MTNNAGQDTLRSMAQLVITRLERLSADSIWAHRASGLSGSLLRTLEGYTDPTRSQPNPVLQKELRLLIEQGFFILENAAREIIPPES